MEHPCVQGLIVLPSLPSNPLGSFVRPSRLSRSPRFFLFCFLSFTPFPLARMPLYHSPRTSVRTGYRLVSRCTPAESGLSGASRHRRCRARLHGALFSNPFRARPRLPFPFFLTFRFSLFFVFVLSITHLFVHNWGGRRGALSGTLSTSTTSMLYHFFIRFLSRNHDARSRERGKTLHRRSVGRSVEQAGVATRRPFRLASREARSRTHRGSMGARRRVAEKRNSALEPR